MHVETPPPKYELTEDALFEGRILLQQPRRGYRFSVDTPLLIWFASRFGPFVRCADLGAGSGAVGIGLLATETVRSVVAVEIQSRLAALCAENARHNELDASLAIIKGDMKAAHPHLESGTFDLVVSNPPFWASDTGRLPVQEERRIACHEIAITLDGVVATAARLLHSRKGRFCIIFPARRLEYLMATLHKHHLNATRIVFVHPRRTDPAGWVLLKARHGHSDHLTILPPLILKEDDDRDTPEGIEVLNGSFSRALSACTDRRGSRAI